MRQVSLGPLKAIMPPTESAQGEAQAPLWVVLLHGFGAPATDLVGLTRALGPLPGVALVYPGALHSLGYAFGEGRAWWPIDFNELDGARRRGDFAALAEAEPAGLSEARAALGEALEVLERDHGLKRHRLVLGGFSQGAMLACDYALRSNSPLSGLVLLSGMPIALGTWREQMKARRGLPVYQSHSPDDLVLPFELARNLGTLLAEAGLAHEFVSFRGGHGIPQPVLEGLRAFLQARSREGAA